VPAVQVGQAGGPVRPVEDVVLLDLDHGQLAALGIQRVPLPGQLLFPGEQVRAGGQPLLSGSNLRQAHRVLL
jgi:hypothetical protein